MPQRSLLWRVVVLNGALIVIAALVLAVSPATVSEPVVAAEVLMLLVGVSVVLTVNVLFLRRMFAPLRQLTEVMTKVDLLEPGRRVSDVPGSSAEVAALTDAFNSMLGRLETERASSVRRALDAQEAERARIARELHDGVGQTLTAIAIEADRASDVAAEGDRHSWERIGAWAERSLDDLRRVGRDLRPEALDDLGLVNALIALCGRVTEAGGLTIEKRFEAGLPERGDAVDLVIYRVAQEALTNVLRHSAARSAAVALARSDAGVVLTVSDDGVGFGDVAAASGGAGITGMRERALLVGAQLKIDSAPERGTAVRLEVPLP
jgi:two-component system sensor histidine kinase UhpB